MAKKAKHPHVVNWNDLEYKNLQHGDHFGGVEARLNPSMPPESGHVGVVKVVLPPGRAYCPFHWHVYEDEIFIILSGSGLFRYGDGVIDLKAGDVVSCPRNSGQGHQIANVSNADLVYLAIGENRKDEICVYPDTGKVLVRALKRLARMQDTEYFHGEPQPPRILKGKSKRRR